MSELPDIQKLITIVRDASIRELLPRFERVTQKLKADGSIITEADLAMQSALEKEFKTHWPAIPFLGEEMERETQLSLLKNSDSGLWVVDPIDGTTNFSLGIPYYGVSVALIKAGEIQLSVVYDPARDECFHAIKGQGAYLNDQKLDLSEANDVDKITAATIDFKRLPTELACKIVSNPPYKSQRSFGSVALDWCWFAAGRGDVYLHGSQNLWDYAGGLLVLEEAGGISSTLEGEPVFSGVLEKRSAVIGINEMIYSQWFSFLAD